MAFLFELRFNGGKWSKDSQASWIFSKVRQVYRIPIAEKAVIRAKLKELGKIINATRKISEGVWLIPDYSGKYHIYRRRKYR